MKPINHPRSVGNRGFTLVELMVVIGVIAVLAGLLLPVLANAKDKGRSAVCKGSLKQLYTAFILYAEDHKDQFPTPGSVGAYGPQPEDWIWWQYGRGVTNSSLAPYLDGFNTKLFTCPSDKEAQIMQEQGLLANDPYRYSYALTSYSLEDGHNPGMATIITQKREVYPFRMSMVKDPTLKLMLVEEDDETQDDSRWVPVGSLTNLVTRRHNKRGNVAFADGHVEHVKPTFGLDEANSRAEY